MTAPFERRAITFDGKPVLLYVSAPPRAAMPFLARCHGASLTAQQDGLDEKAYVDQIRATAAEMGFVATVRRSTDYEIVLDVKPLGGR